jgi:hypothetical protein
VTDFLICSGSKKSVILNSNQNKEDIFCAVGLSKVVVYLFFMDLEKKQKFAGPRL